MQLVVDVGNTETVVGVVEDGLAVRTHWRLSTGVSRTVDEYAHLLSSLLGKAGHRRDDLHRAVVGSVVPSASDVLVEALGRISAGSVHSIGPDTDLPITLDVEEPRTVGADRIVNTLAAARMYGRDTVTVDLGTATTFDVITADGIFKGGVIAPGVSAGLDWLARRTAKLPTVQLIPPEQSIGRRTEECIQAGIFYSVVDSVDGIVRRILEEWDRPDTHVVATGGFARFVAPHCRTVERIEPFLTLYGLAMAGEYLARSEVGASRASSD